MKILVIADIHGDITTLSKILATINCNAFDVIVCPGNITDISLAKEDFTQTDIALLVIQKLILLKKPLFCVPGNHDPFEILNIFDEYHTNIHNRKAHFNSFVFVGFGGAETPFHTPFEPTEKETAAALQLLTTGKRNTILITHNPPKNTKLDIVDSKHVGSAAIRDFIEKTQPRLCLSAHIHERPGTDVIRKTTCFYPGPAFLGNYGIVFINNKKTQCSRKQVKI